MQLHYMIIKTIELKLVNFHQRTLTTQQIQALTDNTRTKQRSKAIDNWSLLSLTSTC